MVCVQLCSVQAVCLWEVCGWFWLCSGTQDRDHGMDAISPATWGLETRVPTLSSMATRAGVIDTLASDVHLGNIPRDSSCLTSCPLELNLKKNA